jgi:hypothetical protein
VVTTNITTQALQKMESAIKLLIDDSYKFRESSEFLNKNKKHNIWRDSQTKTK